MAFFFLSHRRGLRGNRSCILVISIPLQFVKSGVYILCAIPTRRDATRSVGSWHTHPRIRGVFPEKTSLCACCEMISWQLGWCICLASRTWLLERPTQSASTSLGSSLCCEQHLRRMWTTGRPLPCSIGVGSSRLSIISPTRHFRRTGTYRHYLCGLWQSAQLPAGLRGCTVARAA